jgi:uncharacterized protein (DUF1015 family)
MADVAPLDPLSYDPAILPEVIAPPYDVIDPELRQRLAARHAHNVVHLDLPEGDGDERYENARRLFHDWQKGGVLSRHGTPGFLRYAQSFEPPGGGARVTRKGFFALVRATPYSEGHVLPHERTLTGPKLDRRKLAMATRATLSPQFMLYSDPEAELESDLDSGEPVAELTSDDGVEHRLWRVSTPAAIARIQAAFQPLRLLLADGHHRYETSVSVAEELDHEARAGSGVVAARGEHLYTPVFLANGDDPGLLVFPTHRLVHSLADADFDRLLSRVAPLFQVTRCSEAELASAPERALGVAAAGGRCALFTPRTDVDLSQHAVLSKRPAIVRETMIAMLHDAILEDVLGISAEAQAQKTNIRYLQNVRDGIGALERGEGQFLFVCKATPVAVIRAVAEAGEVMPQKSTFFHPKVPTGLLFHTLDPSRAVR